MLLRNECQYGPFPCIKQICDQCPHFFSQMGDRRIIDFDIEEAISDYLQAWKLDSQSSLTARTLGDLYAQEHHFAYANEWYQKAADLQDSIAIFRLAENTRYGRGIQRDLEEAIILYQQAARLGHSDARYAIGDLCVENGMMKVDLSDGLAYFQNESGRIPSLARQSWLDKILAQNRIDFESPELIQLSQMLEKAFPVEHQTEPFMKDTFAEKKTFSFEAFLDVQMKEESINEYIRPLLDVVLPELDPLLAKQTISLKQFARATQQYMIRFQNMHTLFRIDDFCAEIGISRSYYYKIIRCERQPTRDTAIAMAVTLGLNEHETQDYILLLGDRLNEQLKRDWLILECIRRKYTIDQTGQVLNHLGVSPLVNFE